MSAGVAERVYEALGPVVFGTAWWVTRLGGASGEDLAARRGDVSPAGERAFWFHGASAGEVSGAVRLAELFREAGIRFSPVLTAANRAGVELARRRLPGATAVLAPWDVRRWVGRALDVWRPAALFLVETELWPALVRAADERGVPVFAVSARVYPRDVRPYGWIRPLVAPMLRRLAAILARDETERARFVALGAPPERCVVAGNLKYATGKVPPSPPVDLRNRLGLGPDEPLVVFGSLHHDEVALVFRALDRLSVPDWRAVLAPRHAGAVAVVERLARRRGWPVRRWSDGGKERWRILALDTVGELPGFYGVSTVAVVGGGFGRHGGHNPFEPVFAGAPVLFGPNLRHFASESEALRLVTPEAEVVGGRALGYTLEAWLASSEARVKIRRRQREALPDGVAIGRCYLATLSRWIGET